MNCSRTSDVRLKYERLEQTLDNTRDYDIQGADAQAGLKTKAKELEYSANTLKSAPGLAGAGQVQNAAGQLAGKAQQLNTQAEALPKDEKLKELQDKATALAIAAKGDASGLYGKADELSKGTDHTKAKAVIDAFNKVKDAYDALAAHPKYQEYKQKLAAPQLSSPEPGSPEQKVKNVEDAWEKVKGDFQKLCKALIKEFAEKVASSAGNLAENSGNQGNAESVINNFDVVEMAYNSLNDESSLKSEFNAVNQIYDQILNLTKLNEKAKALKRASTQDATTLETAASTLVQNVKTLRDTAADAQTNAENVKDKFSDVKDTFNNLGKGDKDSVSGPFDSLKGVYDNIGFCYKDVKFWSIIVPSIFTMSS